MRDGAMAAIGVCVCESAHYNKKKQKEKETFESIRQHPCLFTD